MRFIIARELAFAREAGEIELVLIDAEPFLAGQEFPAPFDRLVLEIIAEGPVAEHLEEGAVTGVADLVDIAGADAFLHVAEPAARGVLRAEQIRHERMHARHREKSGRVVFGDQRGGGDHGVSLLSEEPEKELAKLGGCECFHSVFRTFRGISL